jgi:hypothetical protein
MIIFLWLLTNSQNMPILYYQNHYVNHWCGKTSLFFLSQLISIFPNKKASLTLDIEENQLAMVAIIMLLKFMVAISPLFHNALRLYKNSFRVVNMIWYEEPTPTEGAFDSLKGGLWLRLGLGNGVRVMGV